MKTNYIVESIKGMKVAIYPMANVQAVMVRLIIRAGSWNESADGWGKLHLLEHMTHNATAKFPDELSLELFKEENGISSNAWTGNANMGYWFEFPYTSFNEGIELFKQVVLHPTLPERDLAREKKIIQQEYIDKWSNPYTRFAKAIDKQEFGEKHIYSRDGMGNPDYLKDVGVTDLEALRQEYFVPGNMVIGVAGKVKVEKVQKAMQEIAGEAFKGKASKWRITPPKPTRKTLLHKEDVDQVMLSLRWLTPGREAFSLKERMTINTAAYLLGGSARSNLFRVLRMQEGLVYKTGAKWGAYPTAGEFEVWCSTNKQDAKRALTLMKETVKKFVSEPIDPIAFARSTKYLNTQTLMSYDSVTSIAVQMSNLMFWNGRVIPPEEFIAIANDITREEVLNMIQKIVQTRPVLAVLTKDDNPL